MIGHHTNEPVGLSHRQYRERRSSSADLPKGISYSLGLPIANGHRILAAQKGINRRCFRTQFEPPVQEVERLVLSGTRGGHFMAADLNKIFADESRNSIQVAELIVSCHCLSHQVPVADQPSASTEYGETCGPAHCNPFWQAVV